MLENRFAQGFLSVTAVAVLVCGALALLSAASDFGRQKNEVAVAVTDPIYSNRLPTRAESEHTAQPPTDPPALAQLDLDSTSSTPDQARSANTNNAAEPQLPLPEAGLDTKVGNDAKNATPASNTEVASPSTALNAEPPACTPATKSRLKPPHASMLRRKRPLLLTIGANAKTSMSRPCFPAPARPKPVDASPRVKKVTKQVPAQTQPSKSRNKTIPAKAMTIGQAEPSSVPKTPSNRWKATGYQAKIWSALARKKPKAGERGSTTVVFGIGGTGALTFVRVGRSSGNSRLDQLAVGTVRNAVPYPAPARGPQSYSIRIDFY